SSPGVGSLAPGAFQRLEAVVTPRTTAGHLILKITVSVVQFRPWAPCNSLQQRSLETSGGWRLARLHELGPHRGLTGRVVAGAGRASKDRRKAGRRCPIGRRCFDGLSFLVVRGAGTRRTGR